MTSSNGACIVGATGLEVPAPVRLGTAFHHARLQCAKRPPLMQDSRAIVKLVQHSLRLVPAFNVHATACNIFTRCVFLKRAELGLPVRKNTSVSFHSQSSAPAQP